MASTISCVLSILLLVSVASGARADFSDGRLPDGTYHCEVYLLGTFLSLGDITIKGNVYSGPVYTGLGTFGTAQQGYNYQMDANGVISWLGPLGGYWSSNGIWRTNSRRSSGSRQSRRSEILSAAPPTLKVFA